MKRRTKVFGFIVVAFGVLLAVGALILGHTDACPTRSAAADDDSGVAAWRYHCYGGPEVLELERVPKPEPAADEVLVRVHAAAANPLDWHYLRGEPLIMRMGSGVGAPTDPALGVDFAGVVEQVGKEVRRFAPGDRVFGARRGAYGEYLVVGESRNIARIPDAVSFEEAAALPVAALTALQALRDQGGVQSGQKVLINGASGGVGTFAVQIARTLGAEVTGVCSTRNVELVKSLGADHVVDYTQQDFTAGDNKYDVIIDNVGNHPASRLRRVLTEHGRVVMVGGLSDGQWLGPLKGSLKAKFYDPFVSQEFRFFMAEFYPQELNTLSALMQSGKMRAVIDRTFPLAELPEAIRYLETGRARGKVMVLVE